MDPSPDPIGFRHYLDIKVKKRGEISTALRKFSSFRRESFNDKGANFNINRGKAVL